MQTRQPLRLIGAVHKLKVKVGVQFLTILLDKFFRANLGKIHGLVFKPGIHMGAGDDIAQVLPLRHRLNHNVPNNIVRPQGEVRRAIVGTGPQAKLAINVFQGTGTGLGDFINHTAVTLAVVPAAIAAITGFGFTISPCYRFRTNRHSLVKQRPVDFFLVSLEHRTQVTFKGYGAVHQNRLFFFLIKKAFTVEQEFEIGQAGREQVFIKLQVDMGKADALADHVILPAVQVPKPLFDILNISLAAVVHPHIHLATVAFAHRHFKVIHHNPVALPDHRLSGFQGMSAQSNTQVQLGATLDFFSKEDGAGNFTPAQQPDHRAVTGSHHLFTVAGGGALTLFLEFIYVTADLDAIGNNRRARNIQGFTSNPAAGRNGCRDHYSTLHAMNARLAGKVRKPLSPGVTTHSLPLKNRAQACRASGLSSLLPTSNRHTSPRCIRFT